MNETRRERAAAYLLGELQGTERERFERLLATDPAMRTEVERLEPIVRELSALPREAWEAEGLPPLKLPVDELRSDAGSPSSIRRWFTTPRIALGGAVAAALFIGGLAVGSQLGDRSDSAATAVAFELQPLSESQDGASGTGELAADDPHRGELVVQGLPASRPGTYYELWLLGEGKIISLGSFAVDVEGHADAAISIPFDPARFDAFDISVERDDGDPSHSSDSVLRGPTTPA
jgi:anti-sigma-K factor RskA